MKKLLIRIVDADSEPIKVGYKASNIENIMILVSPDGSYQIIFIADEFEKYDNDIARIAASIIQAFNKNFNDEEINMVISIESKVTKQLASTLQLFVGIAASFNKYSKIHFGSIRSNQQHIEYEDDDEEDEYDASDLFTDDEDFNIFDDEDEEDSDYDDDEDDDEEEFYPFELYADGHIPKEKKHYYGTSRILKNADNPKRDIKRHGVIIASKKDIERDEKIIYDFLKDFIPGGGWKKEFRKEIRDRWIRMLCVEKKKLKKYEKKARKKSQYNKKAKTAKRAAQFANNLFTRPIDRWADPTR